MATLLVEQCAQPQDLSLTPYIRTVLQEQERRQAHDNDQHQLLGNQLWHSVHAVVMPGCVWSSMFRHSPL